MISFRVLGTIDLRGAEGRHLASPISGSKRLGLLAYLVLAGGGGSHRRDTLVGLFWPESDQKRARNSLSNMLYQIRGSLGGEALAGGYQEVGLAPGTLWCDAIAFEDALDEGRLSDALGLYGGDLLKGFFVSGAAPEFDHWVGSERARLRRRALEAARTLIEDATETNEAIRWVRTILTIDPYHEPMVRQLITLLDEMGDRAGAVRTYEEFAARVQREFEIQPAAETRSIIERVRSRRPRSANVGVDKNPGDLPIRSVAVLPFDNLSGTEDGQPFAAGLHDDLLTELSRISALTVIARTSVLRYRDTDASLSKIARDLRVGTIIEGGVRIAAGRLRLNIQMIDVRTGAHRWAERYDRELSMDNLLDLQSELAEQIAHALEAELTLTEQARVGREPTENLEAYRLYAQGRAFLDRRTEHGMRRSLDYLERAVELDPGYVLAWVGFADALSLLHDYGYEDARTVLPRAEDTVRRALDLDPELAEAHASLGLLHSTRREGSAALRELERAVALRPGYAEAHNWLSWNCVVLGYPERALTSARRAVELDPLSPEAVANLSLSLLINGQAEEALREGRRTRELQPDWTTGHLYEALALHELGRHVEAISVLQDLTAEWAGSGPKAALALTYAATGATDRARALLAGFEETDDHFAMGLVRLALGERQDALDAFGRVDRWGYWEALSMRHFFPEVLGPFREDPLYHRMRMDLDRTWGREPDGGLISADA